jgi:hypothetical protein
MATLVCPESLGGTAWIGCVAKQQEAQVSTESFHGMLAFG